MVSRAALVVGLALLPACGAQRAPATRAVAVAIGAIGTSLTASAQACSARSWEACGDTAMTSFAAGAGVALSAGAVLFLSETSENSENHGHD